MAKTNASEPSGLTPNQHSSPQDPVAQVNGAELPQNSVFPVESPTASTELQAPAAQTPAAQTPAAQTPAAQTPAGDPSAGVADWPSRGWIAGIDYGTVRVGIAVADARLKLATPLEVYQRSGPQADARRFGKLVEQEEIVRFVVGLPVHFDGSESQKSREARQFGQWLQQITSVPVVFHDERYTSVEAAELLQPAGLSKKKRRQRLDALAAQILLQSYLESAQSAQSGQDPQCLEDRERDGLN